MVYHSTLDSLLSLSSKTPRYSTRYLAIDIPIHCEAASARDGIRVCVTNLRLCVLMLNLGANANARLCSNQVCDVALFKGTTNYVWDEGWPSLFFMEICCGANPPWVLETRRVTHPLRLGILFVSVHPTQTQENPVTRLRMKMRLKMTGFLPIIGFIGVNT